MRGEINMTIQSADYTAFKQLATFQSIEELNLSIRHFLYHHSHILNDSTITVLKTIAKYACKVKGVCWTKIDTLASIISLSRSTVERAIRTLKKYGILTVERTQRKQGGYGHNVFIIQKFESDVDLQKLGEVSDDRTHVTYREDTTNTDETSTQQPKNDTETVSFKTMHSNRLKESNNVRERVTVSLESLDYSYCPSHIPQAFRDVCKPFLNALDIFRMYGVVLSAKRYMKVLDIPMNVIVKAFKESIFAYKMGKIKKSLASYFFGTLCNQIAIHQRQQVHIPNWLEDNE
jgi:predicted transcriptional regulator